MSKDKEKDKFLGISKEVIKPVVKYGGIIAVAMLGLQLIGRVI